MSFLMTTVTLCLVKEGLEAMEEASKGQAEMRLPSRLCRRKLMSLPALVIWQGVLEMLGWQKFAHDLVTSFRVV